jgi:Rrf2 family transcriptional regulator, iron-sulfur cluster assembly transcription factor
MVHLAEQPPGRFSTSREICDQENIPPSFLGKVLLPLCRSRMLRSLRGTGGGYELALPPDQIRLLAIVQAIDGWQLDQCVLEDHPCGNPGKCLLHPIWAALREQLLDYLTRTTVADLALMRRSTDIPLPAAGDTNEGIPSAK